MVNESNIPINSVNLKKVQRDYAIAVAGIRDGLGSNSKDIEEAGENEWEAIGFGKKKVNDSGIFGGAHSRAVHLEHEILEELRVV